MKYKIFSRPILDLFHLHSASACVRNSYWEGGRCICRSCKRQIAVSYKIGDDIHIFKFPKFKRFAIDIKAGDRSFIGELSFKEMDEFIDKCRPK